MNKQPVITKLAIALSIFALTCNSNNNTVTNTISDKDTAMSEATTIELEVKKEAKVGEGAIWNYESNRLLWIDIDGKMLYEYDPSTKTERSFELPLQPGTIVPIDGSNILIAMADGFYTFNLTTEELTKKANNVDKWRLNDGKCDSTGRLWVGTLETETYSKPEANFYKVDQDFKVAHVMDSVIISNGIAWSLDGSKMYYIDSPTRQVTCFDFDAETGSISNPVKCVDFKDTIPGTPDGNTIDADGNLWVAFWDGSCIVKCNPRTGEILNKYDMPAHNITSMAFGGENLETLFITTANIDMSEEEKSKYPNAGSLFSFKPGVRGIKANFFMPAK